MAVPCSEITSYSESQRQLRGHCAFCYLKPPYTKILPSPPKTVLVSEQLDVIGLSLKVTCIMTSIEKCSHCQHARTHARPHARTHARTHTYTHTHARTHTHTHTNTRQTKTPVSGAYPRCTLCSCPCPICSIVYCHVVQVILNVCSKGKHTATPSLAVRHPSSRGRLR